jgi:hypothetical protein
VGNKRIENFLKRIKNFLTVFMIMLLIISAGGIVVSGILYVAVLESRIKIK